VREKRKAREEGRCYIFPKTKTTEVLFTTREGVFGKEEGWERGNPFARGKKSGIEEEKI